MNYSEPANVYLTTSFEAVEKYFTLPDPENTTLDPTKLGKISNDDSIFFASPHKNNSVISLTHKMETQQGESKHTNGVITIEIIDPFFTFEEEFASRMSAAGLLMSESLYPEEGAFDPLDWQHTGGKLRTGWKPKEWQDPQAKNNMVPWDKHPIFSVDPDFKDIREGAPREGSRLYYSKGKSTDEYNEDIKKLEEAAIGKLKKIIEYSISRGDTFYLGYGMGTDMSQWAGPLTAKLVGLRLDASPDGVRKITIRLYPQNSPYVIGKTSLAGGPLPGMPFEKISCKGICTKIQAAAVGPLGLLRSTKEEWIEAEQTHTDPTVPPSRAELERKRSGYAIPGVGREGYRSPFDFTTVVKTCYSDYLKNATTSENVITLIPDINMTHSLLIKSHYEKQTEHYNNLMENLPLVIKKLKVEEGATGERVKWLEDAREHHFFKMGPFVKLILKEFNITLKHPTFAMPNSVNTHLGGRSGNKFLAAKDRPVTPDHFLTSSDINTRYRKFAHILNSQMQGYPGENKIEYFKIVDQYRGPDKKEDWSYKVGTKFDPLDSTDVTAEFKISSEDIEASEAMGAPDYTLALNKLLGGFLKSEAYVGMQIISFVETNVNILKFWKKRGMIHSIRPTLVFGEKGLINNFLYAQLDLAQEAFSNVAVLQDMPKARFLSPADRRQYVTEDYVKGMKNLLLPPLNKFFHQDLEGTSEYFASEESAELISELSKRMRIPTFKAYTNNSNVISAKLVVDDSYFALLNRKASPNTIAHFAGKLFEKGDHMIWAAVVEEIIKTIRSWLENDQGGKNWRNDEYVSEQYRKVMDVETLSGKKFIAKTSPGSKRDMETKRLFRRNSLLLALANSLKKFKGVKGIDTIISDILAIYGLSHNDRSPTVQSGNSNDGMIHFLKTLELMYFYAYKINLKTYPFFAMSHVTNPVLGQPCVLLAQSPPIINGNMNSNKKVDKLLSGPYVITGFEHVISRNEVSSNFKLLKAASDSISQDIAPPEIDYSDRPFYVRPER